MTLTICTKEEAEVLLHTSRTGRFVTGDAEVAAMAKKGWLHDHGAQALAGGDHYYTTTMKGREVLNAWKAAQPPPPPEPKLTKSQRRYREYLRSEVNESFGEWIKWGMWRAYENRV
jgi:DNA-binding PadR family transcriptional regulator